MKLRDDLTKLPELVRSLLKKYKIPAASWAVMSEGMVVSNGVEGISSSASKALVTTDTVYEAASISKPVFSYLVHKLVLEKSVELDTPISDLLSHELFEYDEPARRITPRHVLNHTTGLPNWRRNTGHFKTYFEPGSRFSYSGEGFVLLQRLVESVLHTELNKAASEYVFKPLGMNHSSFSWPADPPLEFCVGHTEAGEPIEKTSGIKTEAAGGLHTTALDLASFMCGLLADEQLCSQMIVPGLNLSASKSYQPDWPNLDAPLDPSVSWAKGIGLEDSSQGVNFWQWGDNEGWKAFFVGCAEHRDGAVILTNSQAGQSMFAEFLAGVSDSDHPSLAWVERR